MGEDKLHPETMAGGEGIVGALSGWASKSVSPWKTLGWESRCVTLWSTSGDNNRVGASSIYGFRVAGGTMTEESRVFKVVLATPDWSVNYGMRSLVDSCFIKFCQHCTMQLSFSKNGNRIFKPDFHHSSHFLPV